MPPRQICAKTSMATKSNILLIHVNRRIAITFTVNFIYSSTSLEANSLPRLFTGTVDFLCQLVCGGKLWEKMAKPAGQQVDFV